MQSPQLNIKELLYTKIIIHQNQVGLIPDSRLIKS